MRTASDKIRRMPSTHAYCCFMAVFFITLWPTQLLGKVPAHAMLIGRACKATHVTSTSTLTPSPKHPPWHDPHIKNRKLKPSTVSISACRSVAVLATARRGMECGTYAGEWIILKALTARHGSSTSTSLPSTCTAVSDHHWSVKRTIDCKTPESHPVTPEKPSSVTSGTLLIM